MKICHWPDVPLELTVFIDVELGHPVLSLQRSDRNFRRFVDDAQERPCGTGRVTPTLFPIPQCINRYADSVRELPLCHSHSRSD